MNDEQISEKINNLLNADVMDYDPSNGTQDDLWLVERYSKKLSKKKTKIVLRFASAFAAVFLIAFIGIYLIIHSNSVDVEPSEWNVSVVANVRDAYPDLFYLPEEYHKIRGSELYRLREDNQEKYLRIVYYSSDNESYLYTVFITLNGYIHGDEKVFNEICQSEVEINNLSVRYCVLDGNFGKDSFAIFQYDSHVYILTLIGATEEKLFTVLKRFS